MSLQSTPSAERIHIGLFGRRNAGKSSIMNALTGQNLAIVSDVKGTPTDPVLKSMELLPLGPVVFIDTPGLDDEGELGKMRVKKAVQMLNKTDIALVVVDAGEGLSPLEETLIETIQKKQIPYLLVFNKSDTAKTQDLPAHSILVSAKTGEHIHELKELIAACKPADSNKRIVGDLIRPNDTIVLVTPIDEAAPKGRLILPQQQTIRDILDSDAYCIVTKETTLTHALSSLKEPPALVITDSQAFGKVSKMVDESIPLTSFSILFARYKGNLSTVASGAAAIDRLKDGDTVLICEGCTHHRQCGDIGTVKLPNWISSYTKKDLHFVFKSGTEFPDDLSPYAMVVHCGGCMLNEREVNYRMKCAADQGVPFTNYGILIAQIHGILKRAVAPFSEIAALFL